MKKFVQKVEHKIKDAATSDQGANGSRPSSRVNIASIGPQEPPTSAHGVSDSAQAVSTTRNASTMPEFSVAPIAVAVHSTTTESSSYPAFASPITPVTVQNASVISTVRSKMEELFVAAASHAHGDLFAPLKAALAALIRVGDRVQESWDAQHDFDALEYKLRVLEVTVSNGVDDNLRDHLRAIVRVVQHLWTVIDEDAERATNNQSVPHNVEEIKDIFASLLKIFEFNEGLAGDDLRPPPRSSPAPDIGTRFEQTATILPSSAAVTPPDVIVLQSNDNGNNGDKSIAKTNTSIGRDIVFNQNSNTTYNFGRDIVNNNYIINYGFEHPYFRHYGDEIAQQQINMKAIRAIIGDSVADDALHAAQPKDSGCMRGTRRAIITEFLNWAENDPEHILWLAGMEGTGKTSIAVTLCRILDSDPDIVLGGSFFCSRSAGSISRTDAHCILPTLAVSLAAELPEFAQALAAALKTDDRGSQRQASDQMQHLFVKPLAALASSTKPIIFIIDALDECSRTREQTELISAIVNFSCHDVTVKFLVTSTSTPETHGIPISGPGHDEMLKLHSIDPVEVEDAIRFYVRQKFIENELDEAWYSVADVHALAVLSRGLFIFASTAVLYILDTSSAKDRNTRLQTVLGLMNVTARPPDAMYNLVMTQARFDSTELNAIKTVLACILSARMPLSLSALADLVDMNIDVLRLLLRKLHAVVHSPGKLDQPGLRALHASFADYLFEHAEQYIRIPRSLGDTVLATGCLQVMAKRLRFNVSCSRSSYELNRSKKPENITLSLEYACTQWIFHVARQQEPSALDGIIELVFPPRFLFWLEVVSVLGRVRDAATTLLFAASVVRQADLSRFLRDALAFVTVSHDAIASSAPHIYISALPLASKESQIYKVFAPLLANLISVETFGIGQHGGLLLMTLDGHEDAINSVAYSPDCYLLASCSNDGTVRIWNARTGEYTMSLPRSTKNSIRSVAFDPTGTMLVSGTNAGDAWVWSLADGQAAPRKFHGHSAAILSTTFSPDGCFLASASTDGTARLWDVQTGNQHAVLSGHAGEVTAVAFSYDGKIIASCSQDRTIRLWHTITGMPAGDALLGHNGWVVDVSFSPVSMVLASASQDRTIRLWDVQMRRNIATLSGHSDWICSVQFSRDGKSLVSASHDRTVRLWRLEDDATNVSSIIYDGHEGKVRSATLSPDGLYIASGSEDHKVLIWDAGTGQAEVQSLPAHAASVRSVAVSTDGNYIISGSEDCAIRVWDARTGEPSLPPLQGHADAVTSVAIILERNLLLSASLDHVVQFWDAQTGSSVGKPLEECGGNVSALGISPDARWLAWGSLEGTVRVWDGARRRPSKIGPLVCSDGVLVVTFSSDGKLLAAGDSGGRIHIWYAGTGQQACEALRTNTKGAKIVAFSPDCTRILSSARESETFVWIIDTGLLDFVLDIEDRTKQIISAAYSPDGRYICSGSTDGSVSLWNASKGTFSAMLHGHNGGVHSVVFTPDSHFIVSCSSDATIRVWDVEATQVLLAEAAACTVASLSLTGLQLGWLLGPCGELIQWVPAEYRDCLLAMPCTMLIGQRRVAIAANKSAVCYGENWTSCWTHY